MKIGLLQKCCVAGAILLELGSGSAEAVPAPKQPFDKYEYLCAEQTALQEREAGIPQHLLAAISLAESGRWHSGRRANLAWPWTVMAEGRGRFLATKDDAIAEVRALQSRGVTNIDVGCMQVNLHYHKEAFATLDQAFDPARNVAYAARYLKAMHALTKSWQDAAGAYHSMDPERGLVYQAKVLEFWSAAAGDTAVAALDTAAAFAAPRRAAAPRLASLADEPAPPATMAKPSVPIDWNRTAELNARLRMARADGSNPRVTLVNADHVQVMRQAAAVNDRPISASGGRALAVAQTDRADFAEKRLLQLKAWRERPSR